MKTSRSLFACLLALVAWPVLAFSDDGKKDPPAAADARQPRIGDTYNNGTNSKDLTYEDVVELQRKQVIDTIHIKDQTYGELVDFLRTKSGVNILVAPELQNEKAPEVEMRHVTVGGVLDAICKLTGLHSESRQDGDNVIWFLTPRESAPKHKICRVFKASAKEKLASPQLEQLLANISDAARKICEVNARAQGRAAAEAPIIEAHAGTGILIVAGTESDVQLVGQVIQVLGGEVVPLTSSVSSSGPFVWKDAEGRSVEFEGFIPSSSPVNLIEVDPVVTTDKEGKRGTNVVSGGTLVIPPSSNVPVVTKDTKDTKAMEDTRKQLEAARDQGRRDQVKKLEKQLELLRQQQPATPPVPPAAK